MKTTSRWLTLCLAPCLLVSLSPCLLRGQEAALIDSPMYKAPQLPVDRVEVGFPPDVLKLWLKALERPELDFRILAAGTIARAHQRKMPGIEAAVEPLKAALDQPEQPAAVRAAVARALVTMDARATAPSLLSQAKAGTVELRQIVEPALAAWDHVPARELWLSRLTDPATPAETLVLAVRGLGQVREAKAAERLREIVLADRGLPSVRLAAARSLGQLRDGGLEADAATLAEQVSLRGPIARQAAGLILDRHTSPDAIRLLQKLATDKEPVVASIAVSRLIAIDPKHAEPALDHQLTSADAKLRGHGGVILSRLPTRDHLTKLGAQLDDDHPAVRVQARTLYVRLADNKDLRGAILDEAMKMLAGDGWRGQEQAAVVLTLLDHKPAAKRLVELLRAPRPQVFVTAAWGLRKLAVADTLAGVVAYVGEEIPGLASGDKRKGREKERYDWVDHQLSQLNQFLGDARYQPADKTLRRMIPRADRTWPAESRTAALWALGRIHEDKPDAGLSKALQGRLADNASMPPEDMRVRTMAGVALGRMKATDALPLLEKFVGSDPTEYACAWAVERMTGKPMPTPRLTKTVDLGWFLSPLDLP